jgi:uncharacterized membrane protein
MQNPKYASGTGATAAIAGHPLHPMIVVIPIAGLVGAAITDWVYFLTRDQFWAMASYWLIIASLITGVIAAIAGIIDFMGVERARTMGLAWGHAIGNVAAIALTLVNYLIRRESPMDPALPQALILSTVVFAIVLLTGWLGGEIVFRHGIGVSRGIGGHSDDENPDLTPSGKLDVGKS